MPGTAYVRIGAHTLLKALFVFASHPRDDPTRGHLTFPIPAMGHADMLLLRIQRPLVSFACLHVFVYAHKH